MAFADTDTGSSNAAAEAIVDASGVALFRACDVTDLASLERAMALAADAHGAVGHFVNGGGAPRGSTIESTSLDDWEAALKVNLTTTFLTMKL